MPVSASLLREFPGIPAQRLKGVLIGTEGSANTGKTEFGFSGPGPGIGLMLDRQFRAVLENQTPPETRNVEDYILQNVEMALATGTSQPAALQMWNAFYQNHYLK